MHDHRLLPRMVIKRMEIALVLLLDVSQAMKLDFARLPPERSSRSLPFDR